MISSTNFLNRAGILFSVILLLLGFADAEELRKKDSPQRERQFHIAIYPVENLSAMPAPLKEIKQAFVERLTKQGVEVLDEETLEKFMAKHRIRYVGGIDRSAAKAFKEEIGIDGVLIISLELYHDQDPPKISLLSRLISTGDSPHILWIDSAGLAGDDSPGILGLGLIEDPKVLVEKAIKSVAGSLIRYLSTGTDEVKGQNLKKKFQPKIVYKSPSLDPERKYVIAVLPFFNRSERKYADEILVLHFIRGLKKFNRIHIIEPGILRQELLGLRVILEDGVSLTNADAIFAILDADMIVSGRVMDYQDPKGIWGKPKVDFSTVLIERKSRQVVWGSNSYNEGDDGVFFFDRGKVHTAHTMTSQMVQWIWERILGDPQKGQVKSY